MSRMRALVNRGPDEYPGANYITEGYGLRKMISGKDGAQRETEARRLRCADPTIAAMSNPSSVSGRRRR